MTDEWVKEFRAKYTILVKYEKWPNEEPQLLPEPNWRWTDEAMYNPGIIIGEIDRLLTQATSKAREEALKLRKTEIELFEYLLQRHVDEGSYFGRKDQHYKMRDELLKKLQSLKKDK